MKPLFFFWLIVTSLVGTTGLHAQTIEQHKALADSLLDAGQVDAAKQQHEWILLKDSTDFESNSWLGNYFYLLGKKTLTAVEARYNAQKNPTKMQFAWYKEALKAVYSDDFKPAEHYLKRALAQRQNEYMQDRVDEIYAYKVRIGLVIPVKKKRMWSLF